MTATLEELIAKKEALEVQISELIAIERTKAITEVLALVDRHTLTKEELFGPSDYKSRNAAKSASEVKYKDPVSGETWNGVGIPPVFLRGRDKKDFRV
ncbi:H-NS family nucleoid-associated regulatory protein [Polaromonas sp.]|uniref:H-NS histone family protein n=1 Tax=Polaromonas sp. TaxID=1869339 RepID=UPI0013B7B062|nr:H-NS family nucleoid-associated regulatory protein [Polaromonas sp.]NDP63446.1 H-NS histone family protein [Polaromonas sp.]